MVFLAFSVDALSPNLSGIGRYSWELASRLPWHPSIEDIIFFKNDQRIVEPSCLLSEGTNNNVQRRVSLFKNLGLSKLTKKNDIRKLVKGRLVHGPNYFLPSWVDKGVATIHDLSIFRYPETHPVERILHFEKDFYRSVTSASHLITDSEFTRRELLEFIGCAPEDVTAIPLGVSPNFRCRSQPELSLIQKKYGLAPGGYGFCVSTLEPRKRISNLLTAYRNLPERIRLAYPLILAGGKGWLSEQVHEDISRFSKEGWVRYLGYVVEEDLPMLYAGARAFFFPSIYEGFGLPILEAMSCGVPVVASNRSSLPEVAQNAAYLIDPDDIDALREGIEIALLDHPWRMSAIDKGLAISKLYSWDRCLEATVQLYKKILH